MQVIILDRDGVINHDSPDYIKSPAEWHPIDGSLEAIALLCKKGYAVYVATNQSGVGRGYYDMDTVEAIHQKMLRCIDEAGGRLAGIFLCPHHPEDHCNCRKPKPGMLLDIIHVANVKPDECIFVGDSLRDLEAARAAGCQPVLVETGNGQALAASETQGIARYADLLSFTHALTE